MPPHLQRLNDRFGSEADAPSFTNSFAAHSSKANEAAFNAAVGQVTAAAHELLGALVTHAPPRNRKAEAEKLRARSVARFALRQLLGALVSGMRTTPRNSFGHGFW